MAKKQSPYQEFKHWLFDAAPSVELEDWVKRGINKRAVLSSLAGLDGVTIYLNKQFNRFNTMSLDDDEFYNFVRSDVIKKFRVKKSEMTFFKHQKRDKSLREIHIHFPHLKEYEVALFMELVKDDEDYEALLENLGLSKSRKKKLTKKELRESEKAKADNRERMEQPRGVIEPDQVHTADSRMGSENFSASEDLELLVNAKRGKNDGDRDHTRNGNDNKNAKRDVCIDTFEELALQYGLKSNCVDGIYFTDVVG